MSAPSRLDHRAEATPSTVVPRWVEWAFDRRRVWLLLSGVGLALSLGLVAAFGTDAGISYDEDVQRQYGELVIAWYRSGFEDGRALSFSNLFYYGGLFDALAQLIVALSPLDAFDTRHLLTCLTAVLGLVATFQLAARIGGARAGFFGALLLALTPVWLGHGLFNPKDIPFATAAAFASVTALNLALGPAPIRLRDACLAGVAAGVTLAVRPGGVFVLGYPCLALGLRLALEVSRRQRDRVPLRVVRLAANLVLCLSVLVLVAWPLMLSAWPWAQLEPLSRPLEGMRVARNFLFNAEMLWNGQTIRPNAAPLSYLPLWFNVTLPELYLVALLAGLAVLARIVWKRDWQGERAIGCVLLASFVLVPLAAVFISRPVVYDAHRHFLFLLPPLAAMGGLAFSELLGAHWLPRMGRDAIAAATCAIAVAVAVDIVQLHPYQYAYFNRTSGGLRKQYKRYETDYWGISYREGIEWVVRELGPVDPARRTRITGCDYNGNERLRYYRDRIPGARDKIDIVYSYANADLQLGLRRWNCHRVPGKVVHVVFRHEAPLLYVRRTVR